MAVLDLNKVVLPLGNMWQVTSVSGLKELTLKLEKVKHIVGSLALCKSHFRLPKTLQNFLTQLKSVFPTHSFIQDALWGVQYHIPMLHGVPTR
jgi:hypothetical protein